MEQHGAFALSRAAVFLMALLAGSSSALAGSEPRAPETSSSQRNAWGLSTIPRTARSSLRALMRSRRLEDHLSQPGWSWDRSGGCRRPRPAGPGNNKAFGTCFLGGNPSTASSRVEQGSSPVPRQRRSHGDRRRAAHRAVALVRDVQLQSSLKRANTPAFVARERGSSSGRHGGAQRASRGQCSRVAAHAPDAPHRQLPAARRSCPPASGTGSRCAKAVAGVRSG